MNLKKKWNIRNEHAYQNIFLQTLSTSTKPKERGIPKSLGKMLNMAKKHQVALASLKSDPTLKLAMLIWYHTGLIGSKCPGFNSATAKCHWDVHDIRTVGDLLKLIKNTNGTINPAHKQRKNCKCIRYKEARQHGCKNPHRCGISARKLLQKLDNKWNPLFSEDEGNSNLNKSARLLLGEETSLFNMNVTTTNHLGEGFWVFTEGGDQPEEDQSTKAGTPQLLKDKNEIGPIQ